MKLFHSLLMIVEQSDPLLNSRSRLCRTHIAGCSPSGMSIFWLSSVTRRIIASPIQNMACDLQKDSASSNSVLIASSFSDGESEFWSEIMCRGYPISAISWQRNRKLCCYLERMDQIVHELFAIWSCISWLFLKPACSIVISFCLSSLGWIIFLAFMYERYFHTTVGLFVCLYRRYFLCAFVFLEAMIKNFQFWVLTTRITFFHRLLQGNVGQKTWSSFPLRAELRPVRSVRGKRCRGDGVQRHVGTILWQSFVRRGRPRSSNPRAPRSGRVSRGVYNDERSTRSAADRAVRDQNFRNSPGHSADPPEQQEPLRWDLQWVDARSLELRL